ncbi:MAG TPA: META domain-containing protein [Pyrinomonadaceae bacterium]|nr:META domain-containing protein [Pyrinomonadaceae bacterium]
MTIKTIRMVLGCGCVAITFAALSSALTFAQNSSPLSGTSWQLVKFQGPDESTYTPDQKSKYTITFGSNGRVTARVDCNRASSTWRSGANGELSFGSWSRSSAKCGPNSLHDRIVMEGGAVKKFEIKDGRLYLSAAGGYYELEPMPGRR